MLDKKAFQNMRKEMERQDKLREHVIQTSRSILKNSKKAIYAGHRNDLEQATKLLDQAKKTITKLRKEIRGKDISTGAFNDALEEYAEAKCYLHYLNTGNVPPPKKVGVDNNTYLAALSDLTGELVRKAINSSVKGDNQTALDIKDVVESIYAELMLFDWRNSPIRRKFDAIKYNLEKLEDLALKIKFK